MKYIIPLVVAIAIIYGLYVFETKQIIATMNESKLAEQAEQRRQQQLQHEQEQQRRSQVPQQELKTIQNDSNPLTNLAQLLSNPGPQLVEDLPRMF